MSSQPAPVGVCFLNGKSIWYKIPLNEGYYWCRTGGEFIKGGRISIDQEIHKTYKRIETTLLSILYSK